MDAQQPQFEEISEMVRLWLADKQTVLDFITWMTDGGGDEAFNAIRRAQGKPEIVLAFVDKRNLMLQFGAAPATAEE